MSSQISNLTITGLPLDQFGEIRAFFDRSVALDRLVALLALLEYRLYENFSSCGTRTIIIHPVQSIRRVLRYWANFLRSVPTKIKWRRRDCPSKFEEITTVSDGANETTEQSLVRCVDSSCRIHQQHTAFCNPISARTTDERLSFVRATFSTACAKSAKTAMGVSKAQTGRRAKGLRTQEQGASEAFTRN